MTVIDDLKMFARFATRIRRFVRRPLDLEQAQRLIQERIAKREQNFLRLMELAVFGHPPSPYLQLYRWADCGLEDLRKMVQERGLDASLQALREAGVYLTFEEFKGRVPIQRHGKELRVGPADFFNPYLRSVYESETGGSTGAGTRIPHDLDHLGMQAAQQMLTQEAHGVLGLPTAIWCGVLPDGAGVNYVLRAAHTGHLPRAWFSHMPVLEANTEFLKQRLATLFIVAACKLNGIAVPWPRTLSLDRAVHLARWVDSTVRQHGACLVNTTVSRGLRLSVAAREAGIDLTGATFRVSGEPVTAAKARGIESSGARFYSSYAQSEAGRLGEGCARPTDSTDVHLLEGFCAMVQCRREVPGWDRVVPAFYLTTLLPEAPILMLNTELDDYGVLEKRECGCLLGELGMKTHLRGIHSFSKLTGEGVTLVGSDMVRILEEVLPAHFGGSPLDYQLQEEEDADGLTRLTLVIDPRVPIPDEGQVLAVVMKALDQGGPMSAVAGMTWKLAGSLRVRRAAPVWTARGKLMTLRSA